MRETDRRLDEAGLVHAGTGENRGAAHAARYLDTSSGRIALVWFASTFNPASAANYYSRGRLARNEELVARTVRIARELQLEPASPAEAREMLGLRSRTEC